MKKLNIQKGTTFNDLIVIKEVEEKILNGKGRKVRMFLCKCNCGNEKIITLGSLRNGNTKSCGCNQIKSATTHGMSNERIYNIWSKMVQRCTNINKPDYKNYGGRGIKVCDRWLENFNNFYNDMNENYKDYLTLDRIDNDGDYEPENCRWATTKEQSNNKRNNRIITYNSENKTMSQWAEYFGIKYSKFKHQMVKYDYSIEQFLNN